MRLIDADALIEALGLDQHNNGEGMTSDEEWVAAAIMDAPTIAAEPVRRGRWKLIDGAEPRRYGCSECKALSFYLYHYCPCCGAKMEEQE